MSVLPASAKISPKWIFALVDESGRSMNYRLLLAGLGLVLLVAACAPEPQLLNENYLNDTSFVTGEPCGPPCWRDIVPGETSWQDARTIIEDDPTLDNWQQRADEDSERIGAAWEQADGDLCCQMFSTENGETVELILLQTAPQETLQTVIDEHGEPSYLIGETVTEDQGIVTLFYPDNPMIIYVFVAGETGSISADSPVIGFAYLTENLMQELIETSELHAWEGFGTYSEYMGGEFEVLPESTPDEAGEDE
jgi:hypothetical protein